MSKVIIGIHGLGNKPEQLQLEQWWKAAIKEGLEGRGIFRFLNFKMVYWASILHPEAFSTSITDKDNPLFLNEPYIRANKEELTRNWEDKNQKIRNRFNEHLEKIFIEEDGSLNFSRLTDFIIRHFLKDLDAYYKGDENQARDQICKKLADCLIKHRRKKILLIAHSMGSIITWDVLTRWVPQIKIHTLVTIGSPLGNPVVRSKMLSSYPKPRPVLQTPDNIYKNWYNLSDYKDKVALNYNLNEDFLPNSHGVQPQDKLIWNNYQYNGERNPHKSYGYLRCPEMSNIISEFYSARYKLPHIFQTKAAEKNPVL